MLPGVVWAGTDDGLLQVSRDGGVTFTEVGKNLPGLPRNHQHWISRIDASHFDAGTAYVSVDGHRSDDLKPYVFVTRDYGESFDNITSNLPPYGNVQVIREDPKNRNLLYVGTEFGLFISLDGGKQWQKFMNNYPTVRTDDILVHPRDNDLIVATHGRSVWIADDITPLQQLTPAVQSAGRAPLRHPSGDCVPERSAAWPAGGRTEGVRRRKRTARDGDQLLPEVGGGRRTCEITIADATGKVIRSLEGTARAGINRVMWNLAPNPPPEDQRTRGRRRPRRRAARGGGRHLHGDAERRRKDVHETGHRAAGSVARGAVRQLSTLNFQLSTKGQDAES